MTYKTHDDIIILIMHGYIDPRTHEVKLEPKQNISNYLQHALKLNEDIINIMHCNVM